MGRKKQVKRSESKEASSSTSEKNKSVRKIIAVEDKEGPVEKKLKKETKPVSDRQVEIKKSFDDLPPEMVMKVLKNLSDQDLFGCRLVSRRWNGVASEILQCNAGVELQFACYKVNNELRIKGTNKRSFKSLIKCFEHSPNFPFSRLRFEQVEKSFFEHEDWIKLITDHGSRIKCLILGMKCIMEDAELIQLRKELRKLFLNQLPNLQQFGLEFSPKTIASKIQLFPTTTSNSEAVRLPHLKVIHLAESSFTKQSEIITDILNAAVNLQKIELFRGWRGRHVPIQDLSFLHSLGKLELLQCAAIDLTPEFLSTVKEKCTTPPIFKLEELELSGKSTHEFKNIWQETTVFISNLFESSKDTLTKLNMTSFGFLRKLQLPTFSKLTSLNINSARHEKFLPDGMNITEIFPVLKTLELKLPWTIALSNLGAMHSFPSLETLHVPGDRMNKNSIAQINSICPNLKNLKICGGSYNKEGLENFPEVGKAIWTHLKKLHTLELHINVDPYCSNDQAVDSCITGISKEECKRLRHLIIAEKSLKLARSQVQIPKSEWKATRENASILNLKDLKNLTVHLIPRHSNKSEIEKSMSSVSEKYALQLMENLTYKIKRE